MALLKRGLIPFARYSDEWVFEYLAKRALSREQFLEEAALLTQKDLAKKYHMQKTDVGKILNVLGFDASQAKSQKISAQNQKRKLERESATMEALRSIPNVDAIVSHVEAFGWTDAREHFPLNDVKLLQARQETILGRVISVHASTIKSNKIERELDGLMDDITRLMKSKLSAEAIAQSLGSPTYAKKIRERILAMNPSYEWEVSQESRAKLSLASARRKASRQMDDRALLDELPSDHISNLLIHELLTVNEISVMVKCDKHVLEEYIRERYTYDVAEWENDPYIRRVRVFAKKHNDDFNPSITLEKFLNIACIKVPVWAKHYSNIYKALNVLDNHNLIQRFIYENNITDLSALHKHFAVGSYSNMAGYHLGASEIYDFYAPTIFEHLVSGSSLEDCSETEAVNRIMQISDSFTNTVTLAKNFNIQTQRMYQLIRLLEIPIHYKMSAVEAVVASILDELNVKYEVHNRKILNGVEVDFYIPEANLAIEVNPTHTHNATVGFQGKHPPRPASYHLNKSKLAFKTSTTLIHLYDWDLHTLDDRTRTSQFLKWMIFGADRVLYARSCTIEVALRANEKTEYRKLLKENHRQGAGSAQYYYGLRDPDENLVAVASFTVTGDTAELKRLAFASGVQVRYGLSKLIKAFERDSPTVSKLYSYSNNDYGRGSAYSAAGFSFVRFTHASVSWVNPMDPHDSYSWHVATPWSASSGILARALGSRDQLSKTEIEQLVATVLPHRSDGGAGYVAVHTAGSILWTKTLNGSS